MKQLIIVGAGGFGREVYAWAKAHPDCGRLWEVAGFLDDNLNALDGLSASVPILATVTDYTPREEDRFVCAIGAPAIKKAVCLSLMARAAHFISLVHPTAIVGPNVSIGAGTIICPYAVVTCDVSIGEAVTINCHSTVGHDACIGSWTTLSGHCDVTGQTRLGQAVFLGSGARILPLKTVGDGALVGAGAVVLRSVPDGVKVFGNPAVVFDS